MTTHYKPKADLIETDLDTELALLDPTTQAMFSLNKTGRLVWQSLPEKGVTGAAQFVATHFDISLEQAEKDTLSLVQDLLKAGLLETKQS